MHPNSPPIDRDLAEHSRVRLEPLRSALRCEERPLERRRAKRRERCSPPVERPTEADADTDRIHIHGYAGIKFSKCTAEK